MIDVAVVGAGPAGLATAIGLALHRLDVVVFEHGNGPIDKACGEGVMPVGVARLEALGVLAHLDTTQASAIRGIRYINENGRRAAARLPSAGLGIRRLALSRALLRRAKDLAIEVREGCDVEWSGYGSAGMPRLSTSAGPLDVCFVVAADGLHSKVRERAGLSDSTRHGSRRFGLRRHVRIAPWTDHVEIYFAGEAEAYVTPVGPEEVGIAFLWDAERSRVRRGFQDFLALFPELARRVAGRELSSEARGAGPMFHCARAVVAPNLALVGDAAGYVDAITGEGISLALETSAALVEELASKRCGVMHAYAEAQRRAFRAYSGLARTLLWTARRPRLRRMIVDALSLQPRLFERVLQSALTAARPNHVCARVASAAAVRI